MHDKASSRNSGRDEIDRWRASKMIVKKRDRLSILFVSEYFYPRAAGGEIWSFELCTALAGRGHNVTVMTCRHDDSPREEYVLGVRILRPVTTTSNMRQRVARKIAARALFKKTTRFIEQNRKDIDIIHVMAYTMNSPISAFAKKKGIPCMTSVHSYFGDDWKRLSMLGRVMMMLERNSIRNDTSSIMHVPSRYLQERILADTGRRSVVVHNWLVDDFGKAKKMPPTCVFAGSLEPVKNPLACIDAAKILGTKMLFIGSGILERKIRDEAAKKGVAIEIIHHLPHKELMSRVAGASLLLVPSITESFSLVAVEAIAQGTPVSGTPVGIMPELVGVVPFPPKSIPKRLGTKIQQTVRRDFSKDRQIEMFEILYKKII